MNEEKYTMAQTMDEEGAQALSELLERESRRYSRRLSEEAEARS